MDFESGPSVISKPIPTPPARRKRNIGRCQTTMPFSLKDRQEKKEVSAVNLAAPIPAPRVRRSSLGSNKSLNLPQRPPNENKPVHDLGQAREAPSDSDMKIAYQDELRLLNNDVVSIFAPSAPPQEIGDDCFSAHGQAKNYLSASFPNLFPCRTSGGSKPDRPRNINFATSTVVGYFSPRERNQLIEWTEPTATQLLSTYSNATPISSTGFLTANSISAEPLRDERLSLWMAKKLSREKLEISVPLRASSTVSAYGRVWPSGDQDEKCRKLQYERDNLQLQVQVLTEQIEAQSDKIADLEKSLQEKKQVLADAEEKLQREVLSRSSLETQKLELMSIMSELKLNSAALERENMELRNGQFNNNSSDLKRPPLAPKLVSQPQLTSTPVHHSSQILRGSPSPSPIGTSSNSPRRVDMVPSFIQEPNRPKTPPSTYKRQIDVQYGSLPRQQFLSNGSGSNLITDSNANPHKKGVAFGRTTGLIGGGGYLPVAGGRLRGFSVPNLAESDKIAADEYSKENSPGSPTLSFNKNKGIKKIFGKMKRSGSGNLEDLPAGLGEFQRGGVRATAAARLGWSEPHLTLKPDKPFSEWDGENICDWLQDLGLDQYIPEAKRWVKSGQQLQESPISEIEKELNIKNPLHRKKLQLALIDTTENSSSDLYLAQAGKLDTAWVLRWLDDTGLPQHKESFLINRVDGRVLHRLTIDDLALLHVTSLLHVASIKRGIQVLRENNYEPTCLQRRSLPDDPEKPTPKHVSLWTTHRVMEWLRAVDLAEYAPNLRGAGVHGGLMVLEPKFNADLLASLLSIPPGKTLLRRHLNTHFKELLGKDIIQEKRETEATMGYTPLTPSAKLKVTKKTQFSLKRKKSKGEADYGDLVCPLNPEKQSGDLSSSTFNMGTTKMKGNQEAEDAYPRAEKTLASRSLPTSVRNSPVTLRHV
ncbi:liprin-beta-1-like isoform X5 [Cylas formicarius]|uniref:liprin-beta-1-like isoform X5 n=1 Tax=Cylas formicarius TaxID=197179 RepID=UPI0029587476|nr:liprin-beta-1-like isoform X5 [Cylas formicarius]